MQDQCPASVSGSMFDSQSIFDLVEVWPLRLAHRVGFLLIIMYPVDFLMTPVAQTLPHGGRPGG